MRSVTLTEEECVNVLAALRLLQSSRGIPATIADCFFPCGDAPMTTDEIDALCEKINTAKEID